MCHTEVILLSFSTSYLTTCYIANASTAVGNMALQNELLGRAEDIADQVNRSV